MCYHSWSQGVTAYVDICTKSWRHCHLWHLLCCQKHEAVIPADYCMMVAVLDESMLLDFS